MTANHLRSRFHSVALSAFVTAAVAASLTGCQTQAGPPGDTPSTANTTNTTGTTPDAQTPSADGATIFAAASLSKVFPLIESNVNYSLDGSSGLVDQLAGGAPADVFASADKANMDKAVAAGVIEGDPVMFATNHLVLVTPADNPANITGFDSSLDGTRLVTCAPEVPCGAATARISESTGLTLAPVSQESSVTDVLGKVTSGEADAGIVYATDASGAGKKVLTFEIPGATGDPNTYWIAQVKDAPHPEAGAAFIAAITGPGSAQLQQFGFGPTK